MTRSCGVKFDQLKCLFWRLRKFIVSPKHMFQENKIKSIEIYRVITNVNKSL